MPRTISAAEANRQFSEILGQAAQGDVVTITKRGEPVAQLVPFGRTRDERGESAAWNRLIATLEEGLDLGGERFDRDSLYDR